MTVLSVLMSVTVYSAVIFAATILFRTLFKKQISPQMMYLAWLVLIVRLLFPVTINAGFSLITIPAAASGVQTQYTVAPPANNHTDINGNNAGYNSNLALEDTTNVTAPNDVISNVAAPNNPVSSSIITNNTAAQSVADIRLSLSLPQILLIIWVAGMALMLAQAFASSVRLKRRLRWDSVPVPKRWLAVAENVRAELNVRQKIRILEVKNFISPALSAGIFPVIILPDSMVNDDEEKITFALRHEITHLKRGDHLVCLLLALLRAVYWFNPVVWLAAKLIKTDMEIACDNAAIRPMDKSEKGRYVETVLEMYARETEKFVLGMSLHSTKKTAERRVRGVFMRKYSSHAARWVAAVLAAVMLMACFTTACQPVPGQFSSTGSTAVNPTPVTTITPTETTGVNETPTASPAATATPELSPTQTPEVTESATTEPMASLPKGVSALKRFNADVNSDGSDDKVVVASVNDSDEILVYVLYAGGYQKASVGNENYKNVYLGKLYNGKYFLLVSLQKGSRDYITLAFSFSGLKPVLRDQAEGYIYDTHESEITLSGYVDVIGSWIYTRDFIMTDEYKLESRLDYIVIKNWVDPIYTIRDVPVEMFDGTEATLPKGVMVRPTITNASSYAYFVLDDGSTGRLLFTRGGDGKVYIEGLVASEYFDYTTCSD